VAQAARNREWTFWLFALGVALVVLAIFWSLYAYGQVGSLVAGKGLRPGNLFHCLFLFSENCALLGPAHAERGTLAYSPFVFWAGIAAIVASFWLNLRRETPDERWGPRLQRVLIPVDRLNTLVGHGFAWAIVVLTLAVSYEVFARYVLRAPTTWAFDASYILYGSLFLMAGAYALARNAHVRGDFLYRAWPPERQAGMDLVLYFLFFFPGIIAFIFAGYGYAAQAWMTHEHSAYSPDGLPVYQYKTLIPVIGVLLLLQGIVEVIRCIYCLRRGEWPQRLHDVEELEKIILEQHGSPAPEIGERP
jgi:TRAP-type mannitol/chloroaromatic compound transport system permease small subunit